MEAQELGHGIDVVCDLGVNLETITMTSPAITVLASFDEAVYEATAAPLPKVACTTSLMLSGPGASEAIYKRLGARRLGGD